VPTPVFRPQDDPGRRRGARRVRRRDLGRRPRHDAARDLPAGRRYRFRAARHPDVFTGVLRTVPFLAEWLEVLEPISDVFPMAGLRNTLRRLVVEGQPVVTGLHAIGDTVCTTNPTLGRGLSLAVRGALDLAAALDARPDDPPAQAAPMDLAVTEHVAPFYDDQAGIDAARLVALPHTVLGGPPPSSPEPGGDRVTYSQLRAAAPHDPSRSGRSGRSWECSGRRTRSTATRRSSPASARSSPAMGRNRSAGPAGRSSSPRSRRRTACPGPAQRTANHTRHATPAAMQ
jgi:hypothetical protein